MGYERTVKAAKAAAAVGALVALGARFVAPAAAALVADGLPRAREAAAAWMTPPYLYLVINAIILSIAASSRFHPSGGTNERPPAASAEVEPEQHVAGLASVASLQVPAPVVPAVPVVQAAEFVPAEETVPAVVKGMNKPTPAPAMEKEMEEDEEFAISRSSWAPRRRGADPVVVDKDVDDEMAPFADLTNSREKPLVSARFNRKAAKPKPSPEGNAAPISNFPAVVNLARSYNLQFWLFQKKNALWIHNLFQADRNYFVAGSKALRVARPRKEETLESTWKAITEGRAPPLARHLKKSDTWDTRPGRRPSGSGELDPAVAAPPAAMRKAETFNDGRSKAPAPAPVRREPSLGQDELNRRVEAFINKFNMEMRLQRQESLKYHQEMLRLGRDGLY